MSAQASAIVGALFGLVFGAVVLLTLRWSELRERIARLEQLVKDRLNGR